jgi:uncharacterized protein YndB with AHSA1/START domain
MTKASDKPVETRPVPLRISRRFHAPREIVFRAWSMADHIKRWFAPENCSVSEAKVDMRAGGAFEVRMCGSNGIDHWSRGNFVEVSPHNRLVLHLHVSKAAGRALLLAYTEAGFVDVLLGASLAAH